MKWVDGDAGAGCAVPWPRKAALPRLSWSIERVSGLNAMRVTVGQRCFSAAAAADSQASGDTLLRSGSTLRTAGAAALSPAGEASRTTTPVTSALRVS